MKRLFMCVAAAALLVSGLAHADAIADRKAAMKTKNGASMGTLVKFAKGETTPYDAAAVLAALTTIRESTKGFADLFPAGTETGGETTASPKIWEDMAGFKAAIAKFEGDVDAAIAAAPADQAALGAVLGSVGGNCKSCHEAYRIMKN
jgi:cytochrome c556